MAVYAAAATGLNATYTEHVAPGASVGRHVFSAMKSAGFVPVRVTPVTFNVTAPVFLTVTVWDSDVLPTAVVGKLRLVGLSVTVGTAVPVPVSVTWCGEPGALSVITRAPVSAAADCGRNPI